MALRKMRGRTSKLTEIREIGERTQGIEGDTALLWVVFQLLLPKEDLLPEHSGTKREIMTTHQEEERRCREDQNSRDHTDINPRRCLTDTQGHIILKESLKADTNALTGEVESLLQKLEVCKILLVGLEENSTTRRRSLLLLGRRY
ncbi:hypothetical protein ISN45_At01g070700 [Arabidopsis thaliana x Arabidopsis arenosa]|uniref:Uncharacterized protein n=1 Tax=Arabidopsis thaliana x Arabidopsis arenosa TaxID=1240361 RepID=A0A8T2GX99_9BRAS|nr:hypothetical protein ISN45_At01g070700 [Arabidopsis thaliana x Arabidopsis arenosa]